MAAKKSSKPVSKDEEIDDVPWPEEKKISDIVTQNQSAPDTVAAHPAQIIDEEILDRSEEAMEEDIKTPPAAPTPTAPSSSFGLEMRENGGGKNWVMIIIVVLVLLGLAGGAFWFFTNKSGEETMAPEETVSPVVYSPTPSSSPAAKIDRSVWILEVLNGTGKTGLAAEVKDKLESMGYKVSKVGNASETDKTKIYVVKKLSDRQDELLADLKDEFQVEDVTGVLADSSASARIVLGKDYLK